MADRANVVVGLLLSFFVLLWGSHRSNSHLPCRHHRRPGLPAPCTVCLFGLLFGRGAVIVSHLLHARIKTYR
jgi:hypothetical protein